MLIGLILLLYLTSVFGARVSSSSSDDKPNQTRRFNQEIEQRLLSLFDIPKKPPIGFREPSRFKNSESKFLIDVYKHTLNIKSNVTEFNLTNQDYEIMEGSDTIVASGAVNPGNHSLQQGKRLWFDLTSFPPEEDAIDGEVWLYFEGNVKPIGTYNVSIQHVTIRKGVIRKYSIDSIIINTYHIGWIRLNVEKSLRIWLNHPEKNHGLFLGIQRMSPDKTTIYRSPNRVGVIGAKGDPGRRPFIVGYFEVRSNRRFTQNEIYPRGRGTPDSMRLGRQQLCSRKEVYIDFDDLQWDSWFIAPRGFSASYCEGSCDYPSGEGFKFTNHAFVQGMINVLKPDYMPKPCCTPGKLSGQVVLHYNEKQDVVLKQFENIVVDWCECY